MAILVAPRREAVLRPALAATVRTGCRRYAQAREYRGERLKRARRPQNRAPSHLGAAWRQNGHSGCTTPRGGSAALTRRHRPHRLQARRTGAGVQRGAPEASPKAAESSAQPSRCCLATKWPFWLRHAREAALPPPLAATVHTGCRRYAQARGYRGERLKRARVPQKRARSHLGAAWRQNGHSGCTTHERRPCRLRSPPPFTRAAGDMHRRGGIGGSA